MTERTHTHSRLVTVKGKNLLCVWVFVFVCVSVSKADGQAVCSAEDRKHISSLEKGREVCPVKTRCKQFSG